MKYFGKLSLALAMALAAPPARACDCPSPIVKDWAGNLRGVEIVADYVVERLRRGPYRYTKIATVRVTKGWKGAKTGARLDVEVGGDSTCASGIPKIGETAEKAPLTVIRSARTVRYRPPVCFDGLSARVVETFAAERGALEAKAFADPGDVDAQLALLAHYLYWQEHALALPLAKEVARRWPENRLAQLRLAEALTAAGDLKQASQASREAWESLALRPNLALLEIKMQQARETTTVRGRTDYSSFDGRNEFGRAFLSNSILSHARFPGNFDARGSDFTGARFSDVGFDTGEFSGARLNKAYFSRVEFDGADLSGVEAREFTCYFCSFTGADLRGVMAPRASLYGAKLTRADLSKAELDGADLRDANLRAANLANANLDKANLSGAVLRETKFDHTTLRGAMLVDSDLRGADLSRADLADVKLRGAAIDCATRFPERFDASTFVLIRTQACPNEKPRIISAEGIRRDIPYANFADATINLAAVKYPPALNRSILDRAKFVNFQEDLSLSLFGVSARGALFEDLAGTLSIFDSDASNVTIVGKAGAREPRLNLSRVGGRLDGATLRDVTIHVVESRFRDGETSATSADGLRVEHARIECSADEPSSNVISDPPAIRERDRRHMVKNFVLDLAFARKLASLDASNKLKDGCTKAIELYLSDDCKRGIAKAGFAYQCPPPP